MTRRHVYPLALLGAALLAPPAAAQDSAAAAELFKRAMGQFEKKDYASACPAFGESYRLDPRPGVLFSQAECEAAWGKVATAASHYGDFLALVARLPAEQRAKQGEREKHSKKQLTQLEPRLPRLTLRLPPGAPAGAVVQRDGVALGAVSLGLPLPIDPGEHTITLVAADGQKTEEKVTLSPGEARDFTPRLPAPAAPPPATSAAASSAAPAAPPPPGPPPRSPTLGYVIGGVGLAGLVVGGVTGALAFSRKKDVDSGCPSKVCKNQDALDAASASRRFGNISTVAFGVGVAGVAVGAVLVLTAKPDKASGWRPQLDVGPRQAALGLQGRW